MWKPDKTPKFEFKVGCNKEVLILRSGVFAASRRLGALFSLMVRDGARAPPHHEGPQPLLMVGFS
jgi:hypothetical protein